MTKFGLSYYNSPAPRWVKILFTVIVFPALSTFMANLDEFGLSEGAKHFIQIFSPVIGGAVAYGRDLFGKKSLNETEGEEAN